MRWIGGKTFLGPRPALPDIRRLLQWVYVGRVLLAVVLFVTAAFYFRAQPTEVILALAIAALLSMAVSAASLWYTHIRRAWPGRTFLYAQAVFDLALVTTIVHVTGGVQSDFSALYILVIAISAVLMPVAASLLVALLASLVYFADIVWWHPIQVSLAVWLQLFVFLCVAVAVGWLASRVRVVGAQHEVLQREVTRLRLEAGDILRNIKSGILTVDGAGQLAYANPTAEALLGIDAAALVAHPIRDVLQARAPELWDAIAVTQRGGERVVRGEARITRNGQSFPIGLTTTTLDSDRGQTPSVTAIFSDISDQKRLEALHLRTERLEAVAELSSSLAHEIRNPLASIRSSVEQLARSRRANDDERFLARLVVRESDRLSRLLSEFLDFSRVRVTKARLLDLRAVAEAGVEVVRRHPECPRGMRIAVRGEALSIEGDEDLLHRVAMNLVLNAVQAAGEGGTVTVTVRRPLPEDIPGGMTLEDPVVLAVSDDGPGVAEELRDRIFDPFVSGRVGGSGLGLAIVQRAVQAHRGAVLVESTPAGTTFRVLLPSHAVVAEGAA